MDIDTSDSTRFATAADPALEAFVRGYLETAGALVEPVPHGLEVLLPEALSTRWAVPEIVRLTFAGDGDAPGPEPPGMAAGYGSLILEKMLTSACATVPLARCQAVFHYLKSAGFERLIQEQFQFLGAGGVAVENRAAIQTAYLQLTFAYLAQSDEQTEGLVHVALNLDTRADVTGIEDFWPGIETVPAAAGTPFPWDPERAETILARAEKRARQAVAAALADFEARMNRRFARDAASLEEFYTALREEMRTSLERPGLSEALQSERRAKIDLLPAELARKKEDLYKKYSIRAALRPCAGMLIHTPAVQLLTRVQVGKAHHRLSLVYNPITRGLDPLVCPLCRASTYRLHCSRTAAPCCPRCAAK